MMLVNGRAEDRLDVHDRGLHYGDGLFETMAAIQGRVRHWPRHLARLQEGCRRLQIPVPDAGTLAAEVQQVAQDTERAVVKIIITRGPGGRGYGQPEHITPSRIVLRTPWPDLPDHSTGIRVRLCEMRLGHNPALAGIKHLNRLEQVLARAEWEDAAIAEGLLCDQQDNLIEGTASNVFLVHQGVLHTPALDHCGVAGIMRGIILELADSLGIPVRVMTLSLQQLRQAEEVFISNSLIGLWPVRTIDGLADYAIGETGATLRRQLMEIQGI